MKEGLTYTGMNYSFIIDLPYKRGGLTKKQQLYTDFKIENISSEGTFR